MKAHKDVLLEVADHLDADNYPYLAGNVRDIANALPDETTVEPTAPLRDFNRYLQHMRECARLRDSDSASPTYGKCTCGVNELVARLTVKTSASYA